MVNSEQKPPQRLRTDRMTGADFLLYAGLCILCGRSRSEPGSTLCEECQAKHNRTKPRESETSDAQEKRSPRT